MALKRKSSAKFPPRRFGWRPDLPDYRDFSYAAPGPLLARLPSKVDLRSGCPPVYDQGNLNSCTANAIAGALQFDRMKQGLTPNFIPSRLFIYYNERALENDVDSDAGAYTRDGIKSVAEVGDCSEDEWPYDESKVFTKPSQNCYDDALNYKAISYSRINHALGQMKGCLAEGYPFVFGISIYRNFPMQTKTGAIPMPGNSEGTNEGHAMLAIGYDDSKSVFFIRNSWNTTWGMKGYGTIPYGYLTDPNLSDDFWTIRLVQ
jgi:C1A family cysteine protease